MGKLHPTRLDRHAHDIGKLARGQGLCQPSGVDCKGGRRFHDALGRRCASLRFDEHEFRIKSVYGGMPGANLLDWPITLAEMEPWYAKAENKMGVTRTNGIPGLPGNNNFKVLEAAPGNWATRRCTPETWPSTASRVTGVEPASRSVSASRAASPARSGRRSTPRSRRAKPPGISRCGPTAWRSRSSMTRRAR